MEKNRSYPVPQNLKSNDLSYISFRSRIHIPRCKESPAKDNNPLNLASKGRVPFDGLCM